LRRRIRDGLSWSSASLQSFMSTTGFDPIGLDRSHFDLDVSIWPLWFVPAAPAPALCSSGSSSLELLRSFRVRCLSPPAAVPQNYSASFGVAVLLRDISNQSPLTTSFPSLVYRSALSVSHALNGLRLRLPFGFVSSRSHVQDFSSGCFPDNQQAELFVRLCPLGVFVRCLQ
jgi:hypothetical protein